MHTRDTFRKTAGLFSRKPGILLLPFALGIALAFLDLLLLAPYNPSIHEVLLQSISYVFGARSPFLSSEAAYALMDFLYFVMSELLGLLMTGTYICIVIQDRRGEQLSISGAAKQAGRRYTSLLAANLAAILILAASVSIPLLAFSYLISMLPQGAVVPAVIISTIAIFSIAAIVEIMLFQVNSANLIGGKGAAGSIRSSIAVGRRYAKETAILMSMLLLSNIIIIEFPAIAAGFIIPSSSGPAAILLGQFAGLIDSIAMAYFYYSEIRSTRLRASS